MQAPSRVTVEGVGRGERYLRSLISYPNPYNLRQVSAPPIPLLNSPPYLSPNHFRQNRKIKQDYFDGSWISILFPRLIWPQPIRRQCCGVRKGGKEGGREGRLGGGGGGRGGAGGREGGSRGAEGRAGAGRFAAIPENDYLFLRARRVMTKAHAQKA